MTIEPTAVESLAGIFKALGDPTRLRIFEFLRCCSRDVEIDEAGQCRPANAMSVGEVCCRLDQSMSTVSHHLKELRIAGLIRTEKRGRWIYCSVNQQALDRIRQFLDQPPASCGPAPSTITLEQEREEATVGR
jgi:ArsR family transcriptional regulator, arsenate/arsenite/antimonite-responsive transcriptional repressor